MKLKEDVYFEILLRLPVKSLLRFRYVCKTWYALIKSSRFTHKHDTFLQRAGGDKRIILKYCKDAEKKDFVSLYDDYESLSLLIAAPEIKIPGYSDVHGCHWTVHFVGEANGIFCLANTYNISLMNPVLREFRMLPAFYGCPFYDYNKQFGVGFGFDESTNDYKVLRLDDIENADTGSQYQVGDVYSLSTNSWRDLGRIRQLDSYYVNSDYCYVFFNGSIHWYAMGSWLEDGIFAFNMTTELFQEMPAPEQSLSDYGTPMLFVLHNSFMALLTSEAFSDSSRLFIIWVMKEYGLADSWTREYCIQTISGIERPLSFWKKDKLITTCNDRKLVCYDLPTGQHHLQQLERSNFGCYSFGLMFFNESLISIS